MTEIRFIEPSEVEQYRQAIAFGFGNDLPADDDEGIKRFNAINPVETSIVAVDRDRMVATFGSYDLELTVPGGNQVSVAGTTHVTVHPTHRRQGILSRMMRMHLDQAVERGQPMAGLWASEESIYGRFGYGPAATGHDLKIPARVIESPPNAAATTGQSVTVHPIDIEQARATLPAFHRGQVSAVPGRLVRSEHWWEARFFYQPDHRRGSTTVNRYVAAERDGVVVGYVIYRLRAPEDWSEGTTEIVELVAVDEEARRALWSFATHIDLYRNVRWWNAPIDDPLVIETDRFREIKRTVIDSIWLRPLDIVPLLTARSYERDGTIVVGVVDDSGPASGRYRLETAQGKGICERTTDTADVTLGVAELGRLFLGGGSAFALHRAGLIDGEADQIATLHDLFLTRLQPHCPEVF